MPAVDAREVFDNTFRSSFQEGLARCGYVAFMAAEEIVARHEKPEANYARPHVRRFEFEASLASLCQRHGIPVVARKNKPGTAEHREVVTDTIVLTASYVPESEQPPRPADFRKNLIVNNQPFLFAEMNEAAPTDAALYGIIIYGESDDPRYPAFVDVAFPWPDRRGYAARIELFKRYPSVVNEFVTTTAEEVVGDEAMPKIKGANVKEDGA